MDIHLLQVTDLHKHYGALVVTDGVSLDVRVGEIHALIGPNGAGKTTLVGQVTGLLKSDAGRVILAGQDVSRLDAPARARLGLGRSFQISSLFASMTVLENVALAVQAHDGQVCGFWRPAHAYASVRQRARDVLDRVGISHLANTPCAQLAHGQSRQVELAMVLAGQPRLLVLDEPMAGLSTYESQQVARLLDDLRQQYGMLLIEHDMNVVFALADRISVLVAGRMVCTGTGEDIRSNTLVRQAYLGDRNG